MWEEVEGDGEGEVFPDRAGGEGVIGALGASDVRERSFLPSPDRLLEISETSSLRVASSGDTLSSITVSTRRDVAKLFLWVVSATLLVTVVRTAIFSWRSSNRGADSLSSEMIFRSDRMPCIECSSDNSLSTIASMEEPIIPNALRTWQGLMSAHVWHVKGLHCPDLVTRLGRQAGW